MECREKELEFIVSKTRDEKIVVLYFKKCVVFHCLSINTRILPLPSL